MSGVHWSTADLAAHYKRIGLSCPVERACGNGNMAPKRNLNSYAPYRSKPEVNYARYLDLMVACGVFAEWKYEPEKWRLAYKCFYTPDFKVVLPDGSVEWHECKGKKTKRRKDGTQFSNFWAPPKNFQKLKIAAAMWPERRIFVVWPEDRVMATWNKERIQSSPKER